ncbi:MAG: hypothetical protein L3J74_16130 [Bacteroidales bacterium]|nr:hypothetical protein [Bacteroidales bacterium]
MSDNYTFKILISISDKTISFTNGTINQKTLDDLCLLISDINNSGKKIIVVSAGAILLGTQMLKIKERAENISVKQAIAAVGQVELIKNYQNIFNIYGQNVAQVLLTRKMMQNSSYAKNIKATLGELLNKNIIPIVNENDSVSTDDIELEDNYPLSVKLADTLNIDIIIIASDIKHKFHVLKRDSLKAVTCYSSNELLSYLDDIGYKKHLSGNFPINKHDILIN